MFAVSRITDGIIKIPEETCEYVPTVSFGAAEFCGL
jgi:hypothetical protein